MSHQIPEHRFTAVEYPGFVRNAAKAIDALGGEACIPTTHSTSELVKLALRPGQPFAHPIYAESGPAKSVLLRISRPRQQQRQQADQGPPSDGGCSIQVVGTVVSSFQFNCLADYQYLPNDPSCASRDYSRCPVENHPEKAEPSAIPQPLLCVPPLFSKLNEPFDYAWRQYSCADPATLAARPPVISFYAPTVPQLPQRLKPSQPPQDPQPTHSAIPTAGAAQQQPAGPDGAAVEQPATAAGAGTAQPAGAVPMPMETDGQPQPAAVCNAQGQGQEAQGEEEEEGEAGCERQISQMLSQRPVWSLAALSDQLSADHRHLMLPVVARLTYKFKAGPWRGLYIRRGYDPRTHPASAQYQAIRYTLPNQWYEQLGLAAGLAPMAPAPQPPSMSAIHRFEALPTSRITPLQLCDLHDETIQEACKQAAQLQPPPPPPPPADVPAAGAAAPAPAAAQQPPAADGGAGAAAAPAVAAGSTSAAAAPTTAGLYASCTLASGWFTPSQWQALHQRVQDRMAPLLQPGSTAGTKPAAAAPAPAAPAPVVAAEGEKPARGVKGGKGKAGSAGGQAGDGDGGRGGKRRGRTPGRGRGRAGAAAAPEAASMEVDVPPAGDQAATPQEGGPGALIQGGKPGASADSRKDGPPGDMAAAEAGSRLAASATGGGEVAVPAAEEGGGGLLQQLMQSMRLQAEDVAGAGPMTGQQVTSMGDDDDGAYALLDQDYDDAGTSSHAQGAAQTVTQAVAQGQASGGQRSGLGLAGVQPGGVGGSNGEAEGDGDEEEEGAGDEEQEVEEEEDEYAYLDDDDELTYL